MAAPQTLLQLLQGRTIVDCDCMDINVKTFPLQKRGLLTVYKAIAYFELQKPQHKVLIEESVRTAARLHSQFYSNIPLEQLATEIAMVKLQMEISKFVTGFVHVQTNTYFSYDTDATVAAGKRILEICKHVDSSFDTSRVCLKIPSTWEGLRACSILQSSFGAATLATTLFTVEQAILAAEAGCHYIAPYVNELKVHFEPGFVDHNKAHALCLRAQSYYKANGIKTQVLPASLTSIEEVMALAGVDHITISPILLTELNTLPAASWSRSSFFDEVDASENVAKETRKFGHDEKAYRIAFTRSGGGEGERKLVQAINIFCDFQDKLEAIMVKVASTITSSS